MACIGANDSNGVLTHCNLRVTVDRDTGDEKLLRNYVMRCPDCGVKVCLYMNDDNNRVVLGIRNEQIIFREVQPR